MKLFLFHIFDLFFHYPSCRYIFISETIELLDTWHEQKVIVPQNCTRIKFTIFDCQVFRIKIVSL